MTDSSTPHDRVKQQIESDAQCVAILNAEQNARILKRVREMAIRWSEATTWEDQPATVVRAFGQELLGALAIHRTDHGDAS